MKIHNYILGTILVIGFSFAMLGLNTGAAQAYIGEPITNPDNEDLITQTLRDIDTLPEVPPEWVNPVDGLPITSAEIGGGMAEADMASGAIAAGTCEVWCIPTLVVIAGGVGVYSAMKVGTGLGSNIYKLFHTDYPDSGPTTFSWRCAAGGVYAQPGCVSSISGTGYVVGTGTSTLANPGYLADDGGTYYCVTTGGACTAAGGAPNTFMHSMPGNEVIVPSTQCGSSFTGTCAIKYETRDDIKQHVSITDGSASDYAAAPANGQFDDSANDPQQNTICVSCAVKQLGGDSNPGCAGITVNECAARLALDYKADPTYVPGTTSTPFTIPRPLPNETYNDYVRRLRNEGYLGDITFLDDPGYDPDTDPNDAYDPQSDAWNLQPRTITGVGVGLGIGFVIPLYWPNTIGNPAGNPLGKPAGSPEPWPALTPTISPGLTPDVTILKVPDSHTPPNPNGGPTTPNPPAAPAPPPGTSGCNTPNIPNLNFDPLTSIDFGNQFPFGVFGWITTVFGWFNVSATAPSWDFDMSGLSDFVPGFSAHYSGDLSAFDPYMAAIRTIISFALWIGVVYYAGVAMLGFRSGGDLSESADDAYE